MKDLIGNAPLQMGKKYQESLDRFKSSIAQENILRYLDYKLPLLMFRVTSDKQLGARADRLGGNNKVAMCNAEDVLK